MSSTDASDSKLKGILFDFLDSQRTKFDALASEGRYGDIMRECVPACRGMAACAHDLDVVATGLLHYIMSRAALPSQRKVLVQDAYLDVVIPGLRGMRRDPASSIVVLVCCDPGLVPARLESACRIQTYPGNVWLLTQGYDTGQVPCYTVYGDQMGMADMVDDMVKFVREHSLHRLGLAV